MNNENEKSKPQGRSRNRNRRRNERRNRTRISRPDRPIGPDCPLCSKPIRDVSAAIDDKESGKPAHFDCILKVLSEKETFEDQEKMIYLGSGKFGVVKILNNRKFEIIRKIDYDEEEIRIGWRKEMRFQFPDK